MNRKYTLSYVLTTFNKIEYLRFTLPLLIEKCQENEEIIVTDGGSNDGTIEYLKQAFAEGKIHQFISEKDKGEAHGYNKSILMAKGELIKIITDDDVYDYQSIKQCKEFMLSNSNIDFLFSNIGDYHYSQNEFYDTLYTDNFLKWKSDNIPFPFCGLGLMIKKTSLPLLGLFNPEYINIDHEYSLRITNNFTSGCFYSGYIGVRVLNEKSNSNTKAAMKMKIQKQLLSQFYHQKYIGQQKSKVLLNMLFKQIKSYLSPKFNRKITKNNPATYASIDEAFSKAKEWLDRQNFQNQNAFLVKYANE